jgi:nitrate reductase gamma subunit
MFEALVSSARHVWPMYLLALAAAELLLYLWTKHGRRSVLLVASVIFMLSLLASHWTASAWARQNHLAKLVAVNAISLVGPVAVVVLAVFFARRVRLPLARHATLTAAVFLTMFFFPIWALMVTCASGLDCL